MPKYNLDALGSEEFEHLCQALALKIIGPGAKVYGMGKDGAREATFQGKAPYPSEAEHWDGNWIFQAKFHNIQQIGQKEARTALLAELDNELSKITEKYEHPCDNYILMTNVSLTPVYQRGTKDTIDNEIIPKYQPRVKHIHVWGAEEICRHLDSHTEIRRAYLHFLVSGDIIARLLEMLDEEESDLDDLIKLYCQGSFVHEQYAVLDDAGDVEDEPVALQKVFIDLDVKPPALPQEQQMLDRLPKWLAQAAQDEDRTSALSYLLDDYIPGLVIIGGPGSGKSTLGQYLAQIYRARLVGRLGELCQSEVDIELYQNCTPRIPFRVLLREYAQWLSSQKTSDSLFHYLALQVSKESARNVSSEDIQKIISSNPVLLILDGLDEVPEKVLKRKIIGNITSFVEQVGVLKGDLRVIATTRPYGYSDEFDPGHCLHLTLQKLQPHRAVDYAQLWINAREANPREAERIKNTFDICISDRVVSVLTQTPLQVTILLVIVRARGTPPKQREELFERYMDIIYQREQKKRPELLRTEQHIIYGLHEYLAYILHRRAEKDKTAALMDLPEFRERVREYLFHTNPLLNEKELEDKANQIITEASERLVLIESPQEGRFGFGLPTTREFFAAAYLVDTAKDTKQRDARFKAIARLPYWRNVALFFAGRVGRTRPGEAPSMVDVCRDIDTERVDRVLRRGAQLVTEMIDDRVLREPHNEIGALKYALEMLDTAITMNLGDWVGELEYLPGEYKERVIAPWIEDRMKKVIPENLKLYAEAYQRLFGPSEIVYDAIRRAAESASKDTKLWALTQAIRNKIAEPCIELLRQLIDVIGIREIEIAQNIAIYWSNFPFYLRFPLSSKERKVFAYALFEVFDRHSSDFSASMFVDYLAEIKQGGKFIQKNALFLLGVVRFLELSTNLRRRIEHRGVGWQIGLMLPVIANPNIRLWIDRNASFIRRFCKTFSEEREPFIGVIVKTFEFLLGTHDSDILIELSKNLQEENVDKDVQSLSAQRLDLLDIIRFHGDEEKLCEYHKHLQYLYELYESEEAYRKDNYELNELANKQSDSSPYASQRLYIWLHSDFDPIVEEVLDSEILRQVKEWLESRNLSKHDFPVPVIRVPRDLELCELALEVVDRQLTVGQEQLAIPSPICWYDWPEVQNEPERAVASRLKYTLETVLADYSDLITSGGHEFDVIYWTALRARVVEEKHLVKLYEILKENSIATPMFCFGFTGGVEDILQIFASGLESDDVRVARLSAFSIFSWVYLPSLLLQGEEKKMPAWVGEKLWELAKDGSDLWQPLYVECMKRCNLEWSKWSKDWIEAIKNAITEKLERAWCKVIEEAGCATAKDRKSLYTLLLRILESRDDFAESIRDAAFRRLNTLVYEIENSEFAEASLGLPLSRT